MITPPSLPLPHSPAWDCLWQSAPSLATTPFRFKIPPFFAKIAIVRNTIVRNSWKKAAFFGKLLPETVLWLLGKNTGSNLRRRSLQVRILSPWNRDFQTL